MCRSGVDHHLKPLAGFLQRSRHLHRVGQVYVGIDFAMDFLLVYQVEYNLFPIWTKRRFLPPLSIASYPSATFIAADNGNRILNSNQTGFERLLRVVDQRLSNAFCLPFINVVP